MAKASEDGLDPTGAQTPEAYVQLLLQARARSELSIVEIAQRARERGYDLDPIQTALALREPTLPDWQIVVGLLSACGYAGMQIDRWMRVYHDLAGTRPAAPVPPQPEPEREPEPIVVPPLVLATPAAGEGGWRRRHTAMATTAAAVLAVLAIVLVNLWGAGEPKVVSGDAPPAPIPAGPTEPGTTPTPSESPFVTDSPSPAALPSIPAPAATTARPPLRTTAAPAPPPPPPPQEPGVLRTGTVTLGRDQGIDLDTGQTTTGRDIIAASGDALRSGDFDRRLERVSGQPTKQSCDSIPGNHLERWVDDLAAGQWLCVRTSAGRWARVNVTATGDSLKLAYVVWS